MTTLRLIVMAMILLVGTAPNRAALAGVGFGLNVEIGDLAESVVPVGKTTPLFINVRNTGIRSDYRMTLTSPNPDLGASLMTSESIPLAFNQAANFQVNVTPMTGQVFTFTVTMFGQDPPQEVKVRERTFTIRAVPPPELFFPVAPEEGAELEGFFDITWTQSANAEVYDVYLYNFDGAEPSQPPFRSFTDRIQTTIRLNTNQFEKGRRYAINVVARNVVGTIEMADKYRSFVVKAAPNPTGFSLIQPARDERMSTRPRFIWQEAANAVSYRVTVYPDIDGQPDLASPLRVVNDIPTTNYDWANPPLAASRQYHVLVHAIGESGLAVRNLEGVVPFFVPGLEDFNLILPEQNATNVGLRPDFRWQVAGGASGYIFYIYEETEAGDLLHHQGFAPQGEATIRYVLPVGRTLRSDRVYRWTVVAIRTNAAGEIIEFRENVGFSRFLRTTRMGPFLLEYPFAGLEGVPQKPTFRWRASTGAFNYFIELTRPMSNGKPNLQTIQTSPPIANTLWESEFQPLELGAEYFWRVFAFDGFASVYNYGDWQKFRVTRLQQFNLRSPADDMQDTSLTLTLAWDRVSAAEGYVVNMAIVGGNELPPVVIDRNETELILDANSAIRLNSQTLYDWYVEAFTSAGRDMRRSEETWSFTTGRRGAGDPQLGTCDILEHLIARQRLSAHDRDILGSTLLPVLDASAYVRTVEFLGECDR